MKSIKKHPPSLCPWPWPWHLTLSLPPPPLIVPLLCPPPPRYAVKSIKKRKLGGYLEEKFVRRIHQVWLA